MTEHNLKFGGTFCVLPWIEEYINLSGKKQFCCWSDRSIADNNHANLLRQKIWNEEKIANCESCYTLENNQTISPRQKETIRWFKHRDIKQYFDSDVCPEFRPAFLDLRTNNKCNLACISCNPDSSSLWAKELKIRIEPKLTAINYDKLKQYKKIYMAGGEPLIIEDYIKVLNYVADNNLDIEIVINTNLTNLSDSVISAISKIKNINFTVSIDAYDKINEYHRYPLKWSKFLNNLKKLTNLKVNLDFNTVVNAITIFGLGELTKLSHIPNMWNLSILTTPDWLKLSNIPSHVKPLALDNLNNLKEDKFFKKDVVFRSRIYQIEEEIKADGDSKLLSHQIKILDNRRNINHLDYMGFSLIHP